MVKILKIYYFGVVESDGYKSLKNKSPNFFWHVKSDWDIFSIVSNFVAFSEYKIINSYSVYEFNYQHWQDFERIF